MNLFWDRPQPGPHWLYATSLRWGSWWCTGFKDLSINSDHIISSPYKLQIDLSQSMAIFKNGHDFRGEGLRKHTHTVTMILVSFLMRTTIFFDKWVLYVRTINWELPKYMNFYILYIFYTFLYSIYIPVLQHALQTFWSAVHYNNYAYFDFDC